MSIYKWFSLQSKLRLPVNNSMTINVQLMFELGWVRWKLEVRLESKASSIFTKKSWLNLIKLNLVTCIVFQQEQNHNLITHCMHFQIDQRRYSINSTFNEVSYFQITKHSPLETLYLWELLFSPFSMIAQIFTIKRSKSLIRFFQNNKRIKSSKRLPRTLWFLHEIELNCCH